MRILMICASAPTRERPRAHGFVAAVSQAGHTITLIFVDRAGTVFDDLTRRCERTVPVRHRARLAAAAQAELAARPFNLVHLDGRAAALVQGPLGLPTVIDAGTCGTMRSERAARSADLLLRAARAVQIARARSCHTAALAHRARMIVATQDDAWAVRAHGATSQGPYIVPSMVDLERFAPPTSLRDQDTVLLDLRGLDQAEAGSALRLARATMAQVWARRAESRLMVIGRPPLGVAGSLTPDGRVEFTGSVSDPRGHLATATLALVPVTPCGSAPHAPLEAMATGAPVIGIPALARDL